MFVYGWYSCQCSVLCMLWYILYRCFTSWTCMHASMSSCWQSRSSRVRRRWRKSLPGVTTRQLLRRTFPHLAEAFRSVITYETRYLDQFLRVYSWTFIISVHDSAAWFGLVVCMLDGICRCVRIAFPWWLSIQQAKPNCHLKPFTGAQFTIPAVSNGCRYGLHCLWSCSLELPASSHLRLIFVIILFLQPSQNWTV